MTIIAQYDASIARGEINDDPLQREILIPIQRLADDLQQPESWFPWQRKKSIKGVYLYGSVGVGKTYLVDLFFNNVTEPKKARFHFHHFMQQIDIQLRKLQGQKDPLRQIAKNIAQTTRLLCFDEFLVNDVAYAMILAELLPEFLAQGMVLVVSSNTKPDDLYLNGVHRNRFLPAIESIKKNCDVLFLNEQIDYRVGRAPLLEAYLFPLDEATQQSMERQFASVAKDVIENGVINVQNRDIPFLKSDSSAIWFAFNSICNLPRSQLDYLEIAERFDTVFLSGIPILTEHHTAQAIMFVHFIDVMYDRGIKVIISAAAPAQELYLNGEMKETFNRTLSRLIEMQSVDYLNRHPRRKVHPVAS